MNMKKVMCIDNTNSYNLVIGQCYFYFPKNEHYGYVSKFPRPNTHIGGYQLSRFKEVPADTVTAYEKSLEQSSAKAEENVELSEIDLVEVEKAWEQLTLFKL